MDKRNAFRIGDYVRFHTQHGYATGIIELIITGKPPASTWPRAIITVRNGTFKPKKYIRPLYKLKLWEAS